MGGKNNVARTHGAQSLPKLTHGTPDEVLNLVRFFFGIIDLDPAGHPDAITRVRATQTILLPKYGTGFDSSVITGDGLRMRWSNLGRKVFVNPPYSREDNPKWALKCALERSRGCEIIALVPSSPCARWWAPYRDAFPAFWLGRIRFAGTNHKADFESALVYLGDSEERFAGVFGQKCWIPYSQNDYSQNDGSYMSRDDKHDLEAPCSCPGGQHRRENYVAGICNRDYSRAYMRMLSASRRGKNERS